MKPVIIIPSRLQATRLPNKPLLDIQGDAMITQCWRRAMEADIGPVLVAAGDQEIVDVITEAGGNAILTRSDHPSGSDRIFEALELFDDAGDFDTVVNVQGDLPTIDPASIKASLSPLHDPETDIATLVAEITREEEKTNPNVVKAFCAFPKGVSCARALTFTRATAPFGDGPLYHHIGLYAYRRAALARFVSLPPSPLEIREKLEQLRALENGMRIDAALVDTVPLGVDTPEDLDRARRILSE